MTNESYEPRKVWVCWTKPDQLPEDPDACLLSFMLPSEEEEVERQWRGLFIRAREESLPVREKAREFYIDLVARIGIANCGEGQTLRQALAQPGEASKWWYHPVAFKDCESDPTLDWLIALLTIRRVAEAQGASELIMIGAPWQLTQALKSAFTIKEFGVNRFHSQMTNWKDGLASRCKYALKSLRKLRVVARHVKVPERSFDVVFSSFWDWSVYWDKRSDSLADRYFKELPQELADMGASVGWFAWFDPHAEPGQQQRRLKDTLTALEGRHDVLILQSFLRVKDLLKAVLDFRPLFIFLKTRRQPEFEELFCRDGINCYSLFSGQLIRGFLDASLPNNGLVALATRRSFRKYRPKFTLSFVEHFPYSRAHYSGVREVSSETVCAAVQHASYNREKTFLALHPKIEFKGEPDGCAVPHPDVVCVMGSLGQELFLECGYPDDAVLLTGSPRYDHVRMSPQNLCREKVPDRRNQTEIRVLMVCALEAAVELEMIDAVTTAAHDLTGIQLLLRQHPFSRMESHPKFARYTDRVSVTTGSLDDDLRDADLIIFTYSTVAQEALLKGKTVWQWLSLGFNGSALAEVSDIPRFGSVAGLREALAAFARDECTFSPKNSTRELVTERLFYRADGGAAKRVAKVIANIAGFGPTSVAQPDAYQISQRPS